jgi:hypothetical protein
MGLACCVALAGCGEQGKQDNPAPESADVDTGVCELLVPVICAAACVCNCELTRQGSTDVFADAQMCEAMLIADCDGMQTSASEWSACVSELVDTVSDHSCPGVLELPGDCEVYFVP